MLDEPQNKVSLNPDNFEPEMLIDEPLGSSLTMIEPGIICSYLSIDLEKELEYGGWEPSNKEIKNVHIQLCHPLIKQNLEELAHQYRQPQCALGRLAMKTGVQLLWTFHEIKKLKDIRSIVHNSSMDQDDRQFFSLAKFECLHSGYSRDLHLEFYKTHVRQCDGLSSTLGLSPGIIRQLAIMAGFINANKIPYGDRKEMIEILKAFNKWLKRRLERAEEIKKVIESRGTISNETHEPTTWLDVIGEN
jgi:hypothetical protein